MDVPKSPSSNPKNGNEDYYLEDGFCVFTAHYLIKKGSCCGSGCRHCPYQPKHHRGSTKVVREVLKNL